jgi:hypothetical protein
MTTRFIPQHNPATAGRPIQAVDVNLDITESWSSAMTMCCCGDVFRESGRPQTCAGAKPRGRPSTPPAPFSAHPETA